MRTLRQFRKDTAASVAMIFSLSLLPIFAALGAAVDLTRAVEVRSAVQIALDATALNMAPNIGDVPNNNLQQAANQAFKTFYKGTGFTVVATKLQYGVKLTAAGSAPTTIMKLLKINKIDINAAAMAERPVRKIEVALVIDASGSMKGARMRETKEASNALITLLQNSEAANNISMSIVPFDSQVNVGRSNSSATWLDFTLLQQFAQASGGNFTAAELKAAWPGCVIDRTGSYASTDEAPGTSQASGAYVPWLCEQNEKSIKKFIKDNKHNDALHKASAEPDLPAIQALTSTWSTLTSKIQALDPTDDSKTNLTIGITWGTATLSKAAPFTQAEPNTDDVAKYMIVLTDGDNVKNRLFSSHKDDQDGLTFFSALGGQYKSDAASRINPLTEAACTDAKSKNITIYTVRMIGGNASLLGKCASSADHYKSINDASELTEVFEGIGRNITALRLTH